MLKFSTIREGGDHRVRVMTRGAAWFMDRVRRDTAEGLIEGYRRFLQVSDGRSEYRYMSAIPRLCATCELRLGASGTAEFVAWNGLVVLEVPALTSDEALDRVKRAAMRQPSTWAAMVGADGSSVLLLVRVAPVAGPEPQDEADAEVLHRAAFYTLLPIYEALVGHRVARMEPELKGSVLLPYDEAPLLNTNAVPFGIDASQNAWEAEGTAQMPVDAEAADAYADTDYDLYKRHERLYRRAVNEVSHQQERPATGDQHRAEWFVQEVAARLCSYGLPEGETCCQLLTHLRLMPMEGIDEDVVRTLVATVYAQRNAMRPRNPEPPITQLMHTLIYRLNTHYVLRRNVVMGYAEYRPNDTYLVPWRPVTDEVINTFTTDLQLSGLDAWERDVRRYIYSNRVPIYDPVEDYLLSVSGRWDGNDYIRALARTVPTSRPDEWAEWFHTWFLGMVQQWRGRRMQFGNSVVPLLISAQGMHKSTFCRRLLPPQLRQWGYTDNLSLAEERPVHQAMAQMLLISLDEFNRISPKKQEGLLKNLLQLPSVKVKRPYGRHIEEVPRLASFIATTNVAEVLTDPSGSRRFIGVEVTGSIDVSHDLNYTQLYAQAVAELDSHVRFWFDDAETAAIMQHNRQFQQEPSATHFFRTYFAPGTATQGRWYTAAEVLAMVKRRAGGALREVPTVYAFGRTLNNMEGLMYKQTNKGRAYWLVETEG